MAATQQPNQAPVPANRERRGRFRLVCLAGPVWISILLLCRAGSVQAADPYAEALDKRFATNSIRPEAEGIKIADLEDGIKAEVRAMAKGPEVVPPPSPGFVGAHFELLLALLLTAAFGVVRFGPGANRRWNHWLDGPAAALDRAASVLAEDPGIAEFYVALHEGPLTAQAAAAQEIDPRELPSTSAPDPLEETFAAVGRQLATLRTLFLDFSRASDRGDGLRVLHEMLAQVEPLKQSAALPELRPIWLMAFALEGLLKQLAHKPANITTSALRTAAAALDLLKVLGVRRLRTDLVTKPPIRLLAVDDDLISRRAISLSLKRTFDAPDLAPDGQSALLLATQHHYDVIFLDVEMPGMDGFEVCSKIHETANNRATPVVFVTSHSDFDSRAKSTLLGAHDLIAKPFLTFEIALKALTLVLGGRLGNDTAEPCSASKEVSGHSPVLKAALAPGAPAVPAPSASAAPAGSPPRKLSGDTGHTPVMPSPRESAKARLTEALARLEEPQKQLLAAQDAAKPAGPLECFGVLYVGVHAVCAEAERAGLGAMFRLGSALETMLKKLLDHPRLCTPGTVQTAAAALDLLLELGRTGANPDLAQAPIQLLVVDDDPISRRAISSSLQLAFGRPDSADGGEAALALAGEKRFDLIFLDVRMPGMDGFTACSSIRQTALNRLTPVVFVTSHDDVDARSQAATAGGGGFIAKPVLASQILLTALTFILRSRLAKPLPVTEALAPPAGTGGEVAPVNDEHLRCASAGG